MNNALSTHLAGLGGDIKTNLNTAAGPSAGGYNLGANLPGVIGTVILGLITLLGVIFLTLIVYAGFKWMLAQGEEQKIKDAQNIITNSLIGLIITLAAYAIAYFVVSRLQGAV